VVQRTAATDAIAQSLKSLDELRYALDQAAIVAATDHRGIITYANDKFCDISKYSRQELVGADHRIINSGYHPKTFMRELWRTIARGQVWRGEIRNPADVRERIFEPFFTTRAGGTGLGLGIVKRLIELLNGTIVLNDRPGGGTIGEISVPLAPRPTPILAEIGPPAVPRGRARLAGHQGGPPQPRTRNPTALLSSGSPPGFPRGHWPSSATALEATALNASTRSGGSASTSVGDRHSIR
jgi:hypothetical protein